MKIKFHFTPYTARLARPLDERTRQLEAENAELKRRLDALEKIIRNQNPN